MKINSSLPSIATDSCDVCQNRWTACLLGDGSLLGLENLNFKKVYSTEYNFAHCTRSVSRDNSIVRRPLLRCMWTACIRATNGVSGYTNSASLSIPCLWILALILRIWELRHRYQWVLSKILIRRVDNQTEFTCDGRHRCHYLETNLWLGQVYMQNWTCVTQLLYFDFAQWTGRRLHV